MATPPRREGVLIIRLWFDGDPPTELRARLVEVTEYVRGERPVAVAATAEDLYSAVRDWVEALTPR
jgi:hypothetical protein